MMKYNIRWSSVFWLVAVGIVLYFPALKGGFLNWDDDVLVTENVFIRSLDVSSIRAIFTSVVQGLYMPLTLLSFALEYKLFQLNPFVFHLNNVLLHLMNGVLVLYFTKRLKFSPFVSWFTALIFLIHPMHVESVAWVTERKDVLYTFFYLAGILMYAKYCTQPKAIRLFGVWMLGLLSMLAKPMAVSFPLVLLLLDWWFERKNYKQTLLEKLLFILYIAPLAYINLKLNTDVFTTNGSFYKTILIGIWTLMFYPIKFLLGLTFVPLYELPRPITLLNLNYLISVLGFICWLLAGIRFRKHRLFMFASIFYLVSIFFLLNFDDIHNKSIVADRYMYLPSLGLIIWLVCIFMKRFQSSNIQIGERRFWMIVGIGILSFYLIKTHFQIKVWKNNFSLWNYTARYLPTNSIVYNNRGKEYFLMNKYDLSLKDFNTAIDLDSDYYKAIYNRGVLSQIQGYDQKALEDFNRVILINPLFRSAYKQRAEIYLSTNQLRLAQDDFLRAGLKKDVEWMISNKLAEGLYHQGRLDEALDIFNEILTTEKSIARVYLNRGNVYARKGHWQLAREDYEIAHQLDPLDATALYNLATALVYTEERHQAMSLYHEVIQMDPSYEDAYYNLAVLLKQSSRLKEAREVINRLIDLSDNKLKYHQLRAEIFFQQKDLDKLREVIPVFKKLGDDKAYNFWLNRISQR